MKVQLSALLVCLSLFLPKASFAIGFGQVPLVGVPTGTGIVNGATFGLVGKPNHAYVCGINVNGANYSLSTSITSPGGDAVSGNRAASGSEATRYLNFFVGIGNADVNALDNLVFFVAPSGADEYGAYTMTIGVSGTPTFLSVSCVDTTIVCDFNTFLGQTNFLEFTGLTGKAVSTSALLIKFDGSETARSALTFPAGVRRDVDIHTIAGPNTYGNLFIQPLDFIPTLDRLLTPKVSTYKDGKLLDSLSCQSNTIEFT